MPARQIALYFGGHIPHIHSPHTHLRQPFFIRPASTVSATGNVEHSGPSSVDYPFPRHPHPNPYEIFHLKPGALPEEIKSRYYQLVRIHHPDTPHARHLPSHISHARFQAIQAAHDVLTGKVRRRDSPSPMHSSPPMAHAHRRRHNSHAEWTQAAEQAEETANDRWQDQAIVLAGIAALGLAVVPFLTSSMLSDGKHTTAAQNLAQARREAREVGMSRRVEIRKRVRGYELEREYQERVLLDANSKESGGS
ncbi:uncharacterized protein FOMMEDRAFT_22527 [Fomitiporia mediterranea MF3/22]|uniref:uncharacterized protein n=1 Tax=Fomitiporia mediterranea (strain MF3/22) TaxID=694068 RepID=UPI00044083DF|nr:uncharacterized protein FOMMEDRAFT_22527 [Fomitiporia mediterranea MF3/22]EJD00068.1 hypothetical protein FOMMEDRAFT_22527 [Fomitiporia mediterranea MF3/22]